MADLTPRERLQPSLLDRLTDDEPEKLTEQESRRVLSAEKLRESVRRDLAWLFNTTCLDAVQDLSDFPEVEHSTLNYGLPDLAGCTVSSIRVQNIERGLRRTILEYEPRLVRSSIRVALTVNPNQMNQKALSFTIEAELWSQPVPLRLLLRTDLDLETGDVRVSEVAGPGAH